MLLYLIERSFFTLQIMYTWYKVIRLTGRAVQDTVMADETLRKFLTRKFQLSERALKTIDVTR